MKPPIFLKTIIDVLFIFLLIELVATPLLFILSLVNGTSLPIEINHREVEISTSSSLLLLAGDFVISGLMVYTIYLVRKLIRSFFKAKFFTRLQISLINLIGKLMVFYVLGEFLINLISFFVLSIKGEKSSWSFDLSAGHLIFVLALGLFFIYLGKLFENARTLKEENELTV